MIHTGIRYGERAVLRIHLKSREKVMERQHAE